MNLKNFTTAELSQLEEIHERVKIYKKYDQQKQLEQENIVLRRLLLEAITCVIHGRRPNDEFMKLINRTLRLDKFDKLSASAILGIPPKFKV